MPKKLNVLLADDSAVVRRLLGEVVADHADIDQVFKAKDGSEAVELFEKHRPDVVVLDVLMPVMDGIEAARDISAADQDVPIIMFSAVTKRGAPQAVMALTNGACDYELKPQMVADIGEVKTHINKHLMPKILAWGTRRQGGGKRRRTNSANPISVPADVIDACPSPDIVVVGVSTGGPEALKAFLSRFPERLSVPVVIVQHMPASFTKMLANHLNALCKLPVCEAKDGIPIEPGHVYVAPGDFHLELIRDGKNASARLNQNPHVNSCRPSVDVLFQSVADAFGKRTLAVVLSGMGRDGLNGAKAIAESGGTVIAQDSKSSAVWGMPKVVCESGIAKIIGDPNTLARSVVKIVSGVGDTDGVRSS